MQYSHGYFISVGFVDSEIERGPVMLPRQQHNGRQGLKAGIQLVYELLKIVYLIQAKKRDTARHRANTV